MSKKIKKILGVVAAIAIPFAAPLIAGSAALAGVAGAIGTTATSALVGAGLGAANAAITGGNIGQGALMGGLGGGLGSLSGAGNAAASTRLGQGVQNFFGGAANAVTPIAAPAGGFSVLPGLGVTGNTAINTATGLPGTGGFLANLGKSVVSSVTDPYNLTRAGLTIASELAAKQAAKLTPLERAQMDALAQEQAWRMGITKEQYLANQDLFNQAYNTVKNISPEAEGQRYAASVSGFEPEEIRKVRMNTPTDRPGLLEARERDLGIQQAERRASAYERGYEGGRQAKIAGLSGLSAPGAGASVANDYINSYDAMRQASANRATAAGGFVGKLGDIFFPAPRREVPTTTEAVR